MLVLSSLLYRVAAHKIWSIVTIVGLSGLVGLLDYLTPQEVPSDAFFALPIWLGVLAFGLRGGIAVANSSIVLFHIANYLILGIGDQNMIPALIMNYLLFLALAVGFARFLQSQRQLEQAHASLEARLAELDRLHKDTEELHQQKLRLAVTEERNRLAREIHDVLAQGFLTIVVQVEAALLNWADPNAVKERLAKIDELARHNLKEARRSVANLRPLPLESASLHEALESKVLSFGRELGLVAIFTTSGKKADLTAETEAVIYRITQEAMSNVARHAKAQNLTVTLDYDDDEVCLTVQDDGQGFEATATPGLDDAVATTFGLKTMQERASLVGGLLTLQSKPGQGCRVRALIPYSRPLPPVLNSNGNESLSLKSVTGSVV